MYDEPSDTTAPCEPNAGLTCGEGLPTISLTTRRTRILREIGNLIASVLPDAPCPLSPLSLARNTDVAARWHRQAMQSNELFALYFVSVFPSSPLFSLLGVVWAENEDERRFLLRAGCQRDIANALYPFVSRCLRPHATFPERPRA